LIFQQVTIIGTGLIGGSLGLAAKKRRLAHRIIGCDRDPVLKKALRMRAIDAAEVRPEVAIKASDLVVLATPVGGIIELIERVGPLLKQSTLLTDVGSTKAEIIRRAKLVFGDEVASRFLPGHPMAGKEHSGIEHADANLFEGTAWLLTPISPPKTGQYRQFEQFIRRLGAKAIPMDLERHDRLCAWISHLPQLVSTAVASSLLEEFGSREPLNEIGGRALREITRTASSPYSMWRDIAHTNAGNIEEALLKLEQRLAHIRENLKSPELRAEFERGNLFGSSKPRRRGVANIGSERHSR
jgi:prephenate dehydrogenase